MTKHKFSILVSIAALTISACGGGGSSSGTPPPPDPTNTFSVTLIGVDVDRSADQLPLDVIGLPAEGATVTIRD